MNSTKKIIGFAGRQRAGKTMLSKHLTEKYNGTIVTVADALKRLCCDLIGLDSIEELNSYKTKGTSFSFNPNKATNWATTICSQLFGDYTDEQFNAILGQIKDIYTYNVRELLQFIGTDIIRKYKPNWHVDKMVETINNAPTDLVCVDDIRFPNERTAVENLGGEVFFIIRPDLTIPISNHESETSLIWQDFFDTRVIVNMYSPEYLFDEFDEAYSDNFLYWSTSPIFKHGLDDFNTINQNFGNKSETTDKETIDFIKNQVIESAKNHNGVILLHVHGSDLIKKYNKMLYGHNTWVPIREIHTFNIWNPFIIENIKAWL